MLARYLSGGGYSVDPPISHNGHDFTHVEVQHVREGGEDRTVIYAEDGYPHPLAWIDGHMSDDEILSTFGYAVVGAGPDTASGMVREFHQTFGHPVETAPALIPRDRVDFRLSLIGEEFQELSDAAEERDLVEMADGLADLIYVIHGFALELGVPLDDVVREVHESNMSKLGEDGQPIYNADGKVLKGPNYVKPDIAWVLREAGWLNG